MFYTRDCKYGARPCAFAGGRIVHRALAPAAAVRESIPTRGRRAHSWHRVRMALFKTAAHGNGGAPAPRHTICVSCTHPHTAQGGTARHGRYSSSPSSCDGNRHAKTLQNSEPFFRLMLVLLFCRRVRCAAAQLPWKPSPQCEHKLNQRVCRAAFERPTNILFSCHFAPAAAAAAAATAIVQRRVCVCVCPLA